MKDIENEIESLDEILEGRSKRWKIEDGKEIKILGNEKIEENIIIEIDEINEEKDWRRIDIVLIIRIVRIVRSIMKG